jgi:hypothetical protein
MAELDPDREAALRRLRAAFGSIQVLRIVDRDAGQDQDDDPSRTVTRPHRPTGSVSSPAAHGSGTRPADAGSDTAAATRRWPSSPDAQPRCASPGPRGRGFSGHNPRWDNPTSPRGCPGSWRPSRVPGWARRTSRHGMQINTVNRPSTSLKGPVKVPQNEQCGPTPHPRCSNWCSRTHSRCWPTCWDRHDVRDAVSAAWSLLGNRLSAQAGVADPNPEYLASLHRRRPTVLAPGPTADGPPALPASWPVPCCSVPERPGVPAPAWR